MTYRVLELFGHPTGRSYYPGAELTLADIECWGPGAADFLDRQIREGRVEGVPDPAPAVEVGSAGRRVRPSET